MANGFIRIPRTFYESDLWNPAHEFTTLEAFLDLTRRINFDHRPVTRLIGGRRITYGRNEVCLSVSYLVKAWNWTTGRVRAFLKHLEDIHIIQINRSGRGHVNTICFLFTDAARSAEAPDSRAMQPDNQSENQPDSKPETPVKALCISGKAETAEGRNDKLKDEPDDQPDDDNIKINRETEKKSLSSPLSEEKIEKMEKVEYPVEGDEQLLPQGLEGTVPAVDVPLPPVGHTPSLDEICRYCEAQGLKGMEPEKFYTYYASRGWRIGKSPIRCWQSVLQRWASSVRSRPADGPAPAPDALQQALQAYKAGGVHSPTRTSGSAWNALRRA